MEKQQSVLPEQDGCGKEQKSAAAGTAGKKLFRRKVSEEEQTAAARQEEREAQIQKYAARLQGCIPHGDAENAAQDKNISDADHRKLCHKQFDAGKTGRRLDLLHPIADGAVEKGQCGHKDQNRQAEQ